MTLITFFVSQVVAYWLSHYIGADIQICVLIQCFSLLLLGIFLSALATLNFSLSFFVGVACIPLSFMRRQGDSVRLSLRDSLLLGLFSPNSMLYAISFCGNLPVASVLSNAATEWLDSGVWTQIVIWLIWWPAWFSAAVVLASSIYAHRKV